MYPTPEKIYKEYKNKELNKSSASDIFISLIENSNNEGFRAECIYYLSEIGLKSFKIFKFLEDIFVSDQSEYIRRAAFEALKKNFKLKAIKPVSYVLSKEKEKSILIELINFMEKSNPFICRDILIKRIRDIDERKKEKVLRGQNLKNLKLNELKEKYIEFLLDQSLDMLYFHRHKIPFAVDLFYID
ncbi:MAG: HEAT repeat domain-containing protein [Promethearchaeota archaeon]|nr:MAG: HEAT repeat domain-containing protein [Candidatus Lokiarchaeota archaeon]